MPGTPSRGTLILILSIAGALILGLATVSGSVITSWANNIQTLGIENQRRITVLEAQYAAIGEQLKASAARQADMLELLREHMRKDGK